jgi:RimJ/RimL family protein N-acetyltransferase
MTSPVISFRKAGPGDGETLLAWLGEPHVREFWDLGDDGRANMLNYLQGTKNVFDYWIGDIDGAPFCQVMTTDARDGEPRHLTPFISPHGETWTMDFMIGDPTYVGRGLAAPTLAAFAEFAKLEEPHLASLLIDPMATNTRAIHVYEKAGYRKVAEFAPSGGPFAGEPHMLMSLTF